jgi:hypothetical protein
VSSPRSTAAIVRDRVGRISLRAPRAAWRGARISLEHAPTPRLVRAIRELQAGSFVEYRTSEEFWADVEYHAARLAKRRRR